MSNGEPRPSKVCQACGDTMLSVQYTDSRAVWARRKFCSNTCRFDFNASRRSNKFPIGTPLLTADALATDKLLRRLIAYGLRHNSDLGMGREAFMARARELGMPA